MLNLDTYNNRELQNFLSMLNQCEANGVNDIRFVREKIQRRIDSSFSENRIGKQQVKKQNVVFDIPCPDCNGATKIQTVNTCKSTKMDEPYKSVIVCKDYINCGRVDYFYESIKDLISSITKV